MKATCPSSLQECAWQSWGCHVNPGLRTLAQPLHPRLPFLCIPRWTPPGQGLPGPGTQFSLATHPLLPAGQLRQPLPARMDPGPWRASCPGAAPAPPVLTGRGCPHHEAHAWEAVEAETLPTPRLCKTQSHCEPLHTPLLLCPHQGGWAEHDVAELRGQMLSRGPLRRGKIRRAEDHPVLPPSSYRREPKAHVDIRMVRAGRSTRGSRHPGASIWAAGCWVGEPRGAHTSPGQRSSPGPSLPTWRPDPRVIPRVLREFHGLG